MIQFLTGERQANINIADGKKTSVILESEAAKMNLLNRAQGLSYMSIPPTGFTSILLFEKESVMRIYW